MAAILQSKLCVNYTCVHRRYTYTYVVHITIIYARDNGVKYEKFCSNYVKLIFIIFKLPTINFHQLISLVYIYFNEAS